MTNTSKIQILTGAIIAILLSHRNFFDMIRYVLAVRSKLGMMKAVVFAVMLRLNFMPSHSLQGVIDQNEISFFKGGYEYCQNSSIGVLFFPGALVDPIAYAPLLRLISHETNSHVVCLKLPFRNPVTFPREEAFQLLMNRNSSIKSWIIAGHSMGSGIYGAAGLVAWAKKKYGASCNIHGLVMLAGAMSGSDVNLSDDLNLESLVILGSEDTIVPPLGNSEIGTPVKASIKEKLPRQTKLVILQGANHAGFGNYGPQKFPYKDGLRTISIDEQQKLSTQHIKEMIIKIKRVKKYN